MDAIVTAGGIPLPEDPLYSYTQGEPKAMVDVAGKPMVQWVLDALTQARTVERVVVVGLTEKSKVKCGKPMYFVSNQGKMLENLRAGVDKLLEVNNKARHVLLVSSDIPAISGEMVDWVVNTAVETDEDVYYNVIRRETMDKRFPDSKRTWTHLKDMDVCGGDMNVGRVKLIKSEDTDLWEKITNARKSPLKQAALIGFGTAFRLLTRQLTLKRAETSIMDRLDITGQAIVCPYAEVGMDVDKPHQLEIIRKDLKKRGKKTEKKSALSPKGKPAATKKPAKKPATSSQKGKRIAKK